MCFLQGAASLKCPPPPAPLPPPQALTLAAGTPTTVRLTWRREPAESAQVLWRGTRAATRGAIALASPSPTPTHHGPQGRVRPWSSRLCALGCSSPPSLDPWCFLSFPVSDHRFVAATPTQASTSWRLSGWWSRSTRPSEALPWSVRRSAAPGPSRSLRRSADPLGQVGGPGGAAEGAALPAAALPSELSLPHRLFLAPTPTCSVSSGGDRSSLCVWVAEAGLFLRGPFLPSELESGVSIRAGCSECPAPEP